MEGPEYFELHDTKSHDYIRAFQPSTLFQTQKPKQVVFAENERVVVGGSDHGTVYVFQQSDGTLVDKLLHGGQMVQTVVVSIVYNIQRFTLNASKQSHMGSEDVSIIASASSCRESAGIIHLWRYEAPKPGPTTLKEQEVNVLQKHSGILTFLKGIIDFMFRLAVIVGVAAVLWQVAEMRGRGRYN